MRAAVIDRYGPPEVIAIREVPTPVPGDGDILVRITATTVNSGDARVRGLNVPGGMTLMMRLALGWSGPRQNIGGFEAAGVSCAEAAVPDAITASASVICLKKVEWVMQVPFDALLSQKKSPQRQRPPGSRRSRAFRFRGCLAWRHVHHRLWRGTRCTQRVAAERAATAPRAN